METRLNQFGEIVEDGNCPSCQKPLKEEWVACPHCGTSLGGAVARVSSRYELHGRGPRQSTLPRRTIAPVTLRELESWAYSRNGLNYNDMDAAHWARKQLPFFEEHDFELFKQLKSWAYSRNGLNYNDMDAAHWARKQLPFFEEHDFELFKQLKSWAYSRNGLNYNDMDAAKWAFQALSQAYAGEDIEEIMFQAKEQRSSGGCFISSAVTTSLNLPDDCRELNTLRRFRDTYMTRTTERRLEVEQYYRIAPGIVESIAQRADAQQIWQSLWASHLAPAIAAIERGDNDCAYSIYRGMVDSLSYFLETSSRKQPR